MGLIRSLTPAARCIFCATGALLGPILTGGCAIIPVTAAALPQGNVPPKYRNLDNQSIAVMVWADRGTQIDYPPVQLDTAQAIQNKLKQSQARDLAGANYPIDPRSIVRYQRDHPAIQHQPITSVAPRFGVSRLIYIEIERFDTRSDVSAELFRGSMTASLKVIEVEDGEATIAYEESGVTATFPPRAPRQGVADANDYLIYLGTIDQFSDEVVRRFVPHQPQR